MTVSRNARRATVFGLAAIVALVVLLAWLLWPRPAGSLTLRSGTERHLVTVTVRPPRTGGSVVDIALTDRDGHDTDAMVHLEAIEPRMGYAAPPVMANTLSPGHFRAESVHFMSAGPWQLRLSLVTAGGEDRIEFPLWIEEGR
ncbi:hypothetical protein ACWDSJ_06415 [Nocardia sp. NPDC003482]